MCVGVCVYVCVCVCMNVKVKVICTYFSLLGTRLKSTPENKALIRGGLLLEVSPC